MAHGYDSRVVSRLGPIGRDADNATAASWRAGQLKVVRGDMMSNGAVVAPMFGPETCIGVLAAEVRHGREEDADARAVTAMLAAQLATAVVAWPAATPATPRARHPLRRPLARRSTLNSHTEALAALPTYSRPLPQPKAQNAGNFMLFTLLLIAALAEAPQAPAVPAPQTASQAAELEAAGRYDEALAALQRLAAANPNDHGVRLAIARLHMSMGNPDRAEAVYGSVMNEDASNLDALVGVADARMAQGRYEDALEVLERAEKAAPQNPVVLAGLGRAHHETGRTRLAVAYLERLSTISTAPEYRFSLERARLAHRHRIEVHSFGEQFSGATPNSGSADMLVNFRLNDALRVVGRGQVQRKFSVDDARGGAGLEWRATPYTTVIAHALVGPGNRVMPKGDVLGELDYGYKRASWMGSVRFFEFDGARVTSLSPGLTYWATDRLSVGLRYAFSLTDTQGSEFTTNGHTTQVRGSYQVHPRVWLNLGFAAGIEDFENFSIDRTRRLPREYRLGWLRLDLPSLTSLVGTYEHQWRENEVKMQRFSFSFAQRF